MAIATLNRICKHYLLGKVQVHALNSVDLTVEKGEFVAIMGPSGSGKSTLLHITAGLDYPTSGEVEIDGHQLTKMSDRDLTLFRRRHLGIVFQFFNLLPTLTAEDNIALPLMLDGAPRKVCRAQAADLLDKMGLAERGHHKPDQLSGGERQRVAIARALITEPALILADEPTGNLDSQAGEQIMDILRQSCDAFHQTILMVTHDPRAARYADRTILLQDGRITPALAPSRPSSSRQDGLRDQRTIGTAGQTPQDVKA